MIAKIWTVILFTVWCSVECSEKRVICYYGSWATYRWGNGQFNVASINPALCTHLIYAFAGIDPLGTVVSLDPYLDLPSGKDNFAKFNGIKKQNPRLKTLLAVGGWNEGSAKYSVMAAHPTLRRNFINSALDMVNTHKFDGLDLDWEYPNKRDTVNGVADINNFSELVKEIKEEFAKHGLLVTAAVSAVEDNASQSYNIEEISKHLDMIHVMAYDMNGPWNPITGHNAPLHKGEGDVNTSREHYYSVDVAIEYWLAQGAPPQKLAIGIPFYGRTFTLANAYDDEVGAPATGTGIAGPYTLTSGNIGYNEFCELVRAEYWDKRYDALAKVPFAIRGKNWVSYDDEFSIANKVKWGLQNNITSIMVWSIETDDFQGICGEDFPLLRSINRAIGINIDGTASGTTEETITVTQKPISIEGTTVKATTSTGQTTKKTNLTTSAPVTVPLTTLSTTTLPPLTGTTASSGVCHKSGVVPNPIDCSSFLMCVPDSSGRFYPFIFYCPEKLLFNAEVLACDYAAAVKCMKKTHDNTYIIKSN